jgi:hypothetical protein
MTTDGNLPNRTAMRTAEFGVVTVTGCAKCQFGRRLAIQKTMLAQFAAK